MSWSMLLRVGCVLAVTGTALVWRPSGLGSAADAVLGIAVGLLALWAGHRMKAAPLSQLGGALLGGALTLPVAQSLGDALLAAGGGDPRVSFLQAVVRLLGPGAINAGLGEVRGRWMRAMVARDNRIVDSALIGHVMHSASFFASTSLLAVGALVATLLWAAASAGFTLYVSNFATYDLMYGPLGAVVALLMWFWVSVYVVLLGAELNVALRRLRRTSLAGQQGGARLAACGRAPVFIDHGAQRCTQHAPGRRLERVASRRSALRHDAAALRVVKPLDQRQIGQHAARGQTRIDAQELQRR